MPEEGVYRFPVLILCDGSVWHECENKATYRFPKNTGEEYTGIYACDSHMKEGMVHIEAGENPTYETIPIKNS